MSSKRRKEEEIEGKVIAYKSTIQTKVSEATIKAATFASNIQQTKSEALKHV